MKQISLLIICALLLFSFKIVKAQDYFQQEVNYEIQVHLDDVNHTLEAFLEMEYRNNSNDTLEYIWFHLWPNAYANQETALARQLKNSSKKAYRYLSRKEYQGNISALDFHSKNIKLDWEYHEEYNDVCKVELNMPLPPGESVAISTPFKVKIPLGKISRLGHIDQSYQITQWFPKPAVYDNTGWHYMPYLNMGEFYSEYGSFDVSITLPDNYVVGATGDLTTESEIAWLNEKAEIYAQKNTFDTKDPFPKSSNKLKTIRYVQNNVHDFAWFADKRYNVAKSELTLPRSGRKVSTWAMFTDSQAKLWGDATTYINDALSYYSSWYMDYPYNHCTAVFGGLTAGGGMEYPNVTVVGETGNPIILEMTIIHEVGHNWFYGLLGSNERDYGWIDEGLNSFSESRYMNKKYKNKSLVDKFLPIPAKKLKDKNTNYQYYYLHKYMYTGAARLGIEQASETSSEDLTMSNYGIGLYQKPSVAFFHLYNYLGEKEFDRIMAILFDKWCYKHPQPKDIRSLFENESQKDLTWLFDDLLKSTKYIDYKIKKVKDKKVLIKNTGQINAPLSISATNHSDTLFTFWVDGFSGEKWFDLPKEHNDIEEVIINIDEKTGDIYNYNNRYRTNKFFKKTEALSFSNFININGRNTINIAPVMGAMKTLKSGNFENKAMFGLYLFSSPLMKPKFEYRITGFLYPQLQGNIDLEYNILPKSESLGLCKIYMGFKAYNNLIFKYSTRFKIGTKIRFTPINWTKAIEHSLDIAFYRVNHFLENSLHAQAKFYSSSAYQPSNFMKLSYEIGNFGNNPANQLTTKVLAGNNLVDISLNYKGFRPYFKNKTAGVNFEVSANYTPVKKALGYNGIPDTNYAYNMNNYPDYEYDYIRYNRGISDNSSIFDAMFVNQGGALYTPYLDVSTDMKLTLKLAGGIPGLNTNFIQFFANAALYKATQATNLDPHFTHNILAQENLVAEAGIQLNLFWKAVSFYLPIVHTNNLNKIPKIKKQNSLEQIRFSINFDMLKLSNYLDGRINLGL